MEDSPGLPPLVILARDLIWGPAIVDNIFEQWSQGFVFSEECRSALVQEKGGPCSVIVPTQAFILKHLILDCGLEPGDATNEQCVSALHNAFATILLNLDSDTISIATLTVQPQPPFPQEFHKHMTIRTVQNKVELLGVIESLSRSWQNEFGVLLFLYSVILTRGVDNITVDLGAMGDGSLIESTFGHGNQSLLSLLMHGVATPNVFDLTRNVAGLDLVGIQKQNDIGFLTLLEALRYCQVGDFLKCPALPIWVIGSESHLSLIFSSDRSLCVNENSPFREARAAFDSFDGEGNGFIPSADLPKVLEKLSMETEEEYVDFMRERLDPDNSGIILFPAFIEEFVPEAWEQQDRSFQHKTFQISHYNGLKQSNAERKVVYRTGAATVYMEFNQAMEASSAPTPLLRVLRTKWPTIEIEWQSQPCIS